MIVYSAKQETDKFSKLIYYIQRIFLFALLLYKGSNSAWKLQTITFLRDSSLRSEAMLLGFSKGYKGLKVNQSPTGHMTKTAIKNSELVGP